MTWIKCSERMPEESALVIIAFYNGTRRGSCTVRYEDGEWRDEDGEGLYHLNVTEWMPFPAPPEETKP